MRRRHGGSAQGRTGRRDGHMIPARDRCLLVETCCMLAATKTNNATDVAISTFRGEGSGHVTTYTTEHTSNSISMHASRLRDRRYNVSVSVAICSGDERPRPQNLVPQTQTGCIRQA